MKKALIASLLLNFLIGGYFIAKRIHNKKPQIEKPVTKINTRTAVRNDSSKIGRIKRVLILGNSIVRHGPLPSIGWNNNWGMAASSMDSDFVHILMRTIKQKDTSVKVLFENIASFEREFDTYNLKEADTFKSFKPDMIIMRICENISGDKAILRGFIQYYDALFRYIDPSNQSVKVITGGFWSNDAVTRMLSDYAYLKNHTFIDQSEIYSNQTKAIVGFKDPGVQEHPNNLGMAKISESIWNVIGAYFIYRTSLND